MALDLRLSLKAKEFSFTMSWIDDEAKKHFKEEAAEEDRKRLVATSNYWEKLVRQVEHDVNKINAHPDWQKKLSGRSVTFGESLNAGGYRVAFPGVIVNFYNEYKKISIKREFVEDNPVLKSAGFKRDEVLDVVASKDNVILKSRHVEGLIVPQEASQYILQVVVDTLKIRES